MVKILINSAADTKYIYRLFVLYQSIRTFHKRIYIDLYLINVDRKDNLFNNIDKDEYLQINHINVDINDQILINYCANIRCQLLDNSINNYDIVFWFDADSIVRRPLDNLFNIFKTYKMAFYMEPRIMSPIPMEYYVNIPENTHKKFKIRTGIIGFRNCKESKMVINRWNNEQFKIPIENWEWGQDQLFAYKYLIEIIKKFQNIDILYNLPSEYIDWGQNNLKKGRYSNDSFIWVGKGIYKDVEQYLDEEQIFSNNNPLKYNYKNRKTYNKLCLGSGEVLK